VDTDFVPPGSRAQQAQSRSGKNDPLFGCEFSGLVLMDTGWEQLMYDSWLVAKILNMRSKEWKKGE
jgi:hypothetical protein